MSKQWALCWSQKHNATQVVELEAMLAANRKAYRDNVGVEYVALFLGQRGHVEAAAHHCSATLVEREFGLQALRPEPATSSEAGSAA